MGAYSKASEPFATPRRSSDSARYSSASADQGDTPRKLYAGGIYSLLPIERCKSKPKKINSILRSVLSFLPIPAACKRLILPSMPSELLSRLGNRVTGTLYGFRKGHVHLAVQEDPKSHPFLLLELSTLTSNLVKEMASGLVRIALECEKTPDRGKLHQENVWTMYCNGKKAGYAIRRIYSEADCRVLGMVQAVSMGAGVLPMEEELPDGDLMYMRARFERVVGSKDSEALYMLNPDGTGGPELSIFLLRI